MIEKIISTKNSGTCMPVKILLVYIGFRVDKKPVKIEVDNEEKNIK